MAASPSSAEVSKIGDLVWAKMKGFSPWPGRVAEPTTSTPKKQNKKSSSWIYFFGSNNYAWIEHSQIKPYQMYKQQFCELCKTAPFKEAIDEIEKFIKKCKQDENYETSFDNLLKDEEQKRKEHTEREGSVSAKKPKKITTTTTVGGTPANKRTLSQDSKTPTPVVTKRSRQSPAASSRNNSKLENGTSDGGGGTKYDGEVPKLPPMIEKPVSPLFDLSKISDEMKKKNITASQLAFGFIGLGTMGSRIVKNLINSGHRVNLWNRSPQKCDEIKDQADKTNHTEMVQTCQTPYDVVQNSDIIFSCLSDPRAVKEIVIGSWGVIHQCDGETTLKGKGYVEMTSIDPETSKDLCNIIEKKGGRFLEAQLQGSSKQADEGTLIVLTAGDSSLFEDCQTCFKAMGKTAFYLGKVGSATRMNLCINTAMGVALAGLAESMVLAERCGLSCKDFMEIFNLSEGASNYMHAKGQCMIQRNYAEVEQALEYMQKDLKLCLDMSNEVKQNVPVTAAANEAFKMARRAGYDGHDVSIVYMKMRH